jgi:hypothetical protein
MKRKRIRRYTPAEDQFLKENYLTLTVKELGLKLNRCETSAYGRCQRLGLVLPKELVIERKCRAARGAANKGRFPKGHSPYNKGMKGWYAPGSEKGWFEQGRTPPNWRPIGSTRLSANGYIEIKVSNTPPRWELMHRKVWREHNGPIPKGTNIRFKDGNVQNCNIENLYAVSDADNMVLNSIQRYPPELKKAIKQVSKLKRLIASNANIQNS